MRIAFPGGPSAHANPALVAQKLLMVMLNTVASSRSSRVPCPGGRCLFALLVCLLVRSNCAGAEEPQRSARAEGAAPLRSMAPAGYALELPQPLSSFDMARFPELYTKFAITPSSMYSTADFRPRGASLSAREPAAPAAEPIPLLRDTTMWERMADYRTSRGIRLLTLWESAGSTLSLQTGHGGGPSLQWTSRSLGRGAGTRSLLDHLFSTTIGDMQPMARSGKGAQSTRPTRLFDRPEDPGPPRRD